MTIKKSGLGKINFCLLLILTFFVEPSYGTDLTKTEYKIGFELTFPPMSFPDDEQKYDGFEVQLIKNIANELDIKVDLISDKFDNFFDGLDGGKYDMVISSITITRKRKEKYGLSDPYLKSGMSLAIRRELGEITSLEHLIKFLKNQGKDIRIGAIKDTTAYDYLQYKVGVNTIPYDEYGGAISNIKNNSLDGFLGDALIINEYNKPIIFKNIKVLPGIISEECYAIAVKKGNDVLLKKINLAINNFLSGGTIKSLHKKYGLGKLAKLPSEKDKINCVVDYSK